MQCGGDWEPEEVDESELVFTAAKQLQPQGSTLKLDPPLHLGEEIHLSKDEYLMRGRASIAPISAQLCFWFRRLNLHKDQRRLLPLLKRSERSKFVYGCGEYCSMNDDELGRMRYVCVSSASTTAHSWLINTVVRHTSTFLVDKMTFR